MISQCTNRRFYGRRLFVMILCVFVVSGCASFRKKFVRQKKGKKKEKFIPVLDPVTYEARTKTQQEKYRYHYSMWKVWARDLVTVISTEEKNEKRIRTLLAQIIEHLDAMESALTQNQKAELQKNREGYVDLQKEYDKPEQLRSYTRLRNSSRRLEKAVALSLKPENVFIDETQN